MGRKAKIKKMRREGSVNKTNPKQQKNDFIEEIERLGYQFDRIQESPKVPEKRIDPQL